MTTDQAGRPSIPKPVTGTCRLENGVLTIAREKKSFSYLVEKFNAHPNVASECLTLTKLVNGNPSDERYEVWINENGTHCTCWDFLSRRDGVDRKGCKHIAACKTLGLIG